MKEMVDLIVDMHKKARTQYNAAEILLGQMKKFEDGYWTLISQEEDAKRDMRTYERILFTAGYDNLAEDLHRREYPD